MPLCYASQISHPGVWFSHYDCGMVKAFVEAVNALGIYGQFVLLSF